MKETIRIRYGKAVRDARIKKGISQERLADLSELHRTYISDIELGKRNVSIDNIEKIADALDMKISDIFLEMEGMNDESI